MDEARLTNQIKELSRSTNHQIEVLSDSITVLSESLTNKIDIQTNAIHRRLDEHGKDIADSMAAINNLMLQMVQLQKAQGVPHESMPQQSPHSTMTDARTTYNSAGLGNISNPKPLNFSPKLECPKFDGSNPRNWLDKCGRYFDWCTIPLNQRVYVASLYMTGKAEEWMGSYMSTRIGVCWNEFMQDLIGKFGDEAVDVCETNSLLEVAIESAMKLDMHTDTLTSCCADRVGVNANDVHHVFDEVTDPLLGNEIEVEVVGGPHEDVVDCDCVAEAVVDEVYEVHSTVETEVFVGCKSEAKSKIGTDIKLIGEFDISLEVALDEEVNIEITRFDSSREWQDECPVDDWVHDTYKVDLEGKDLAYDSRIVLTFGVFPRVKLKFNVLFANKVSTGLKVIIKDSNHGPVDHKLVDKNPNKAVSMFWTAIKAGDRVDSALKDMAVVMKQLDRSDEVIKAIKFFRHLCLFQSLESLDNILVELYKRSVNLACYLAARQRRFFLAAKLKEDEESVNELDDDAAVYDNKDKNLWPSVVFYERNGVERSSFSVNERMDVTVENLKWNCNSELLAAVVSCKTLESLKSWVFNNNHWYLTQKIRYLRQDGVKFSWDPTNPHQMICFLTTYNFVWITAVKDNSTALVIDDSKNLWVVSLSDSSLCVVELPAVDSWEELDGREFKVEPSWCKALGSSVHFLWLDSLVLLTVSHFDYNRSSDLENFSSCKDWLLCMQGLYLAQRVSATAIAVADVLLLHDNISAVPFYFAKSNQTASLVKQNVALALFSIGPKLKMLFQEHSIWIEDLVREFLREHNVGTSTCLNFSIQKHKLLLVESEESYGENLLQIQFLTALKNFVIALNCCNPMATVEQGKQLHARQRKIDLVFDPGGADFNYVLTNSFNYLLSLCFLFHGGILHNISSLEVKTVSRGKYCYRPESATAMHTYIGMLCQCHGCYMRWWCMHGCYVDEALQCHYILVVIIWAIVGPFIIHCWAISVSSGVYFCIEYIRRL